MKSPNYPIAPPVALALALVFLPGVPLGHSQDPSSPLGAARNTAPGNSENEVVRLMQDEAGLARYCQSVAGNIEHAPGLIQVCKFALSRYKELPDVLCERDMKRSWSEFGMGVNGNIEEQKFSDVITATVRYKDGEEIYDGVRINGKPVLSTAPQLSGTWSGGEFATILEDIFRPSSKTTFIFDKVITIESRKVLVFKYHVESQNNRSYVLHVDQKFWFPEYSGRLWVEEQSSELVKLERKTVYMHDYPIRRMETGIEYSPLSLGDNTRQVMPVRSSVLICMPPPMLSLGDVCARHSITFTNWRKFGVTTKILPNAK